MPVLRRLAVLKLSSNPLPSQQAPDPRREILVRAAEDTDVYFEIVDDGMTPVQYATGQEVQLTVRPTPTVDDEKVLRLAGVPQPLVGDNVWKVTFTADTTRRKSTEFTRGYYDLLLIRPGGSRDFVIETSPFRLLGSPGAP